MSEAYKFKPYYVTQELLDQIPIVPGQLIIITDKKAVYMDTEDGRKLASNPENGSANNIFWNDEIYSGFPIVDSYTKEEVDAMLGDLNSLYSYELIFNAEDGHFTDGTNIKTTTYSVDNNEVVYADVIDDPIKDNSDFLGWYNDSTLEDEYEKNQLLNVKLTSPKHIYSKYELILNTLNFVTGEGSFADGTTSKRIGYTMSTRQEQQEIEVKKTETVTKKSSTTNINQTTGEASGTHGNNEAKTDVINIPGATKLHVKMWYATESTSYDWVVIWAGNYPSYTAANNYSSGITTLGTYSADTSGKWGGHSNTTKSGATVIEGDINGEYVTFGWRSDDSVAYYGYYAEITADITTTTTEIQTVTINTGSLAEEPETPTASGKTFEGWYTDSALTTKFDKDKLEDNHEGLINIYAKYI